MQIDIPKLKPEGEWFEGHEDPVILELGQENHMRLPGPIHYHLWAQPVCGKLVVKGDLALGIELECGRCTDFFSTTIRDSSFLRDYDISGGVETVDVTPDIREAILLAWPAYPVCGETCLGLCPRCGCNLNSGKCSCHPPEGNLWGALEGLKLT